MRNFVFTIVLLLTFSTKHAYCSSCEELQSRIDQLPSIDSLVTYLSVGIRRQRDANDFFKCLGKNNVTQRLPTAIISTFTDTNLTKRNFIYGNGYGTVRTTTLLPFWNQLQKFFGRRLWHGKIFKLNTPDNTVSLRNMMAAFRSMLFPAEVYGKGSIVDGLQSVVFDYRKDSIDIISRLRDEVREVPYRGNLSGVYLGRINLYNGTHASMFTAAWDDIDNFAFAANFLLDFREKNQYNIPQWALKNYL